MVGYTIYSGMQLIIVKNKPLPIMAFRFCKNCSYRFFNDKNFRTDIPVLYPLHTNNYREMHDLVKLQGGILV